MDIFIEQQGALVERALVFRARIMHETFGVDPSQDMDSWDAVAHHIIAVEDDEIVGYYRAITDSELGFYSESEFDIAGLQLDRKQILEIGRAAAVQAHPLVMLKLWKSVIDLAKTLQCKWIMGAASLIPSQTNIIAARDHWRRQYGYVHGAHARPKNPYSCDLITEGSVPKLIKIYEKMGAVIASDPSWDPVFGTADVITLLQLESVDQRWVDKLLS
jgi:putative hemolysin